MKKFVFALTVVATLLAVNLVAIAQVSITLHYTADNEITAFYYANSYTILPLPLGPGAAWWPTVDSYTAYLEAYTYHYFIWEIKNWDYKDPNFNPGGFLAEITPATQLIDDYYSSSALSSTDWYVYVSQGRILTPVELFNLTWSSATTYGANSDPTIWNKNLGKPVDGIDGAAQWIWGPNNYGDLGAPAANDRVYVLASVYAHAPEPGTLLLLGSGLLGLGIVARIRRKKSKS